MKKFLKLLGKYIFLVIIGGIIYMLAEMCARGYSHWSMFVLGGVCFLAIGAINERIPWEMPLWLQMVIGGAIVTVLEFACGCIVNLWLGWYVWDYSAEWGNFLGQICPKFTLLWVFISVIAIILDDCLRFAFFDEDVPRYKLF